MTVEMDQTMDPNFAPVTKPHKGTSLPGLSITLLVISTIAICLRFWSRALNHGKKFGADDWTALAAWVSRHHPQTVERS